MNPQHLAAAMRSLLQFRPRPAALALDGADSSARLIWQLHAERAA